MATPGGPRPGNVPPNYNPNSIANNMQNLQLNRPNRPLTSRGGGGGPRPPPPGIVHRSAMPPPSGPPQGALPPFMANRPNTGGDPPSSNQPPSFVSRPMPPGPSPFSATSTRPGSSGPPPGAPMSNGPPAFGPGGMQGGPNNLPGGIRSRPSAGIPPPRQTMSPAAAGPPFSGQSMHSGSGSQSNNPQLRPGQPAPPFSAPPSDMQPSAGPPSFSTQSQGMPQPQWRMQSRQNVPPPPIPGSGQPPRMYGMQQQLPNQQAMATISPTMGPTGAAGTGPSRIDPNQIPRPIPTSSVLLHETRHGNQANPPPPATSEFIVRDTGNCSPRYMRCTINQIPCTSDLLTTSGMQLALLVQPLSLPHPSEEPIQIVDFGEGGPVRCSRCKGYINIHEVC